MFSPKDWDCAMCVCFVRMYVNKRCLNTGLARANKRESIIFDVNDQRKEA
jgi:hypothetical protein